MKEEEIRPRVLLDKFLDLSEQDAKKFFAGNLVNSIACIACGGNESEVLFNKGGFVYSRCSNCLTLFNSPRAPLDYFIAFYKESASWKYWSDCYFPAIAERRREKIFIPRVKKIANLCRQKCLEIDTLVEVGAGYGIFLEEWKKEYSTKHVVAIEPSPTLAEVCRSKGFEVIEDVAENVSEVPRLGDLVVCFEVLEHVYDPHLFLTTLRGFVKPNGYLLITTLGYDGFDLQVLGENSDSIFPPHHINFPTIDGFKYLFERAGFASVEITTPGVLDVDIVVNAALQNPSLIETTPFLKQLLRHPQEFQSFLSSNKLSSHTWILAKR